ncbi:MAG: YjfB family protein [Clostridiales bacterium]|nr:YjfB family protein [Clostridiales bacterium]
MDIAQLSMNMSCQNLMADVGTAVLANTLDLVETNGEEMTKMMEQSVQPYLGQNIDLTV